MTIPFASPGDRHPLAWRSSAPFLAAHLVPLLAVLTGVSRTALVLAVVLYTVRLLAITAGYHRYFSHRSYRLGRLSQFVLAFVGTTAVQKGPLWWAAHHRAHHRYADTSRDPHSPQMGLFWSHVGWILSGRFGATDHDAVRDLARFPELRFLDRHDWIGPWALGVTCFLIGGWSGLVVGFFASTVVLWHATFTINSLAHVFGRRRYATQDTSRNSLTLALLTFGEGWHNNHHHHPACARQGFRWWQLDLTYLVLRAGRLVGVVRSMREPSPEARRARQVRHGHVDVGMLRQHLARAAAISPDSGELRHALAMAEAAAADGASRVRAGAEPLEPAVPV